MQGAVIYSFSMNSRHKDWPVVPVFIIFVSILSQDPEKMSLSLRRWVLKEVTVYINYCTETIKTKKGPISDILFDKVTPIYLLKSLSFPLSLTRSITRTSMCMRQ